MKTVMNVTQMLLFRPVFCIFQTKMNIGCDMKRFHNGRLPEVNDYTIWRQMNPVKPVHIWRGAARYAHSSIPQFHSTIILLCFKFYHSSSPYSTVFVNVFMGFCLHNAIQVIPHKSSH